MTTSGEMDSEKSLCASFTGAFTDVAGASGPVFAGLGAALGALPAPATQIS